MSSTFQTLTGYQLIEQIYNGSRTQVYRGVRSSDQKPVVIKLLKSEYPTFSELVQFRHQYTIAKNLDLTWDYQTLIPGKLPQWLCPSNGRLW
jgi:serine/threonine protein kinase